MKVYVDELPKSCRECPCCSEQDFAICSEYCEVLNEYISEIVESEQELKPKTCPLHSLADYTKQVRKEVVDKVYAVLEQAVPHDLCWSWAVIKKELDQIQGETK